MCRKTWKIGNTPSRCQFLGVVVSYFHFNKVMEVRWVGARISYRSIMYDNDKSVVHYVLNLSYHKSSMQWICNGNLYTLPTLYSNYRSIFCQAINVFIIMIFSFEVFFLQIHYIYIFVLLANCYSHFFYFNKTLFLFHVQIILKSTLFLALGIFLTLIYMYVHLTLNL